MASRPICSPWASPKSDGAINASGWGTRIRLSGSALSADQRRCPRSSSWTLVIPVTTPIWECRSLLIATGLRKNRPNCAEELPCLGSPQCKAEPHLRAQARTPHITKYGNNVANVTYDAADSACGPTNARLFRPIRLTPGVSSGLRAPDFYLNFDKS